MGLKLKALVHRLDVEMIEQQVLTLRNRDQESDGFCANQDVPRLRRRETRAKAFPGAGGIEPSDSLQALTHGFDADGGERLKVRFCGWNERDALGLIQHCCPR